MTIFYGIGKHQGNARSQNAKGHILGHVRNIGLNSNYHNVRIYQTRERQTFHTDSCDIVGLLCLQTAMQGGMSLLVSADNVFNEMMKRWPDLLELLLRLWLSIPGDRSLPFVFSTRFESVEAGNRGGIVVPGTRLCIPWMEADRDR